MSANREGASISLQIMTFLHCINATTLFYHCVLQSNALFRMKTNCLTDPLRVVCGKEGVECPHDPDVWICGDPPPSLGHSPAETTLIILSPENSNCSLSWGLHRLVFHRLVHDMAVFAIALGCLNSVS